ncbi:MAG: insulinase family protein [Candidatus Eisenbacteria bacterium]|nr:insulinase family protein [Candidatus Eisenbacteria bacterium]
MSAGVDKSTLASGITLLTQPMPDRRTVSLGVWVRTGSRDETPERLGIAHFIEHMMFKGTETRDARAIAASLESLGGQLDAFTTREQVCYTARALSEHLPEAVDVLADILCRSRFDSSEVEREKSVVREEILSYEDNPEERLGDQLAAQVWGDHALGRPILGTADTVGAFTPESLLANFRRRYRGDQLVVAAAGDLRHEDLLRLIESSFAPPSGEPPVADPVPRALPPSVRHTVDDVQQLYLSLGAPAMPYGDPRRYALVVLDTLLGGGMSSRLFQRIREEAGLAYSVYSALDFLRDGGSLSICLAVAPERGRKALELLREELAKIAAEGPAAAEVDTTKRQLHGSIVIAQESVSGRMYHMARQELYTGAYTPPERQVERILAVTREQVAALAAEFLRPERFTLGALGPAPGGPITEADWQVESSAS